MTAPTLSEAPPVVQTAADFIANKTLTIGDRIMGSCQGTGPLAFWIVETDSWLSMVTDGPDDVYARPQDIHLDVEPDGYGPVVVRSTETHGRRIVTLLIPEQTVRVLVDTSGWDEACDINSEAIDYAMELVGCPNVGLDCDPIRIDVATVERAEANVYQLEASG